MSSHTDEHARAARAAGRAALAGMPDRDVDLFDVRMGRYWRDLEHGLRLPYGEHAAYPAFLERLVGVLAARYRERPEELKRLDLARSIAPDWFQDPSMIGYVFYVGRFAHDGKLAGVAADHLDYLAELGVRYVHLMALLAAMPDAYEATLPEIFPDFAPGNFTFVDGLGWVWTTFNQFQWDLNWSNPRVFLELADVLLYLANRGVEVVRLDAVAFIWKRLGTNCQNQPEVHDLMQALRACARIVAPAVAFKAEAIVSPDDLAFYLGVGRHHGKVSDLAYHNSLMVQLWSALATRDARLATKVLAEFPAKPPSTAWATYVRCHDDIGWAITEADAAAVGWDGPAHRAFLADYYAGTFPGSSARGVDFQANRATGDRRTSGTTASLAGLELGLERADPLLVDLSIRRILLGHALIFGYDGIPLVYMGDELGMLNDWSYLDDPDHAADNRWLHRPRMDWELAARRHDPGSVPGRIFAGLVALARARRATPHLHAGTPLAIVDLGQASLLAFVRRHALGPLLAVHNLTERTVRLDRGVLDHFGLGHAVDRLAGGPPPVDGDALVLAPYQAVWLTAAAPGQAYNRLQP